MVTYGVSKIVEVMKMQLESVRDHLMKTNSAATWMVVRKTVDHVKNRQIQFPQR